MTKKRCFTLLLLVTCLTAAPLYAQVAAPTALQTPTAAQTQVDSLDDALVSVVIGDVEGLFDQFGQLASQSRPEMTGDGLKQMFGAQIGDPQLKGLPPQSGAVMLIFPGGGRAMLFEVAPESMSTYEQSLAAQGGMTAQVEGLLVSALDENGMAAAKAVAAEVKAKILSVPAQPNVVANIDMEQAMALYGPQMRFMIQSIATMASQQAAGAAGGAASQPDPQAQQRMIQSQLGILFDLAQQVDRVVATVSFSREGARLDKVVTPKQGSDLLAVAQGPTQSGEALARMLPAGGAVRGYMMFNGPATAQLINNLMKNMMTQMALDPAVQQSMAELISTFARMQGQGFNYLIPGQPIPSGSFIYQAESPEAAQEMVALWMKSFQSDFVAKFYGSLGMPATVGVTEKAREVEGVPVAQIKMDVQMPQTPGVPNLFPITYEQASVNNMILATLGGSSIEELIKSVKAAGTGTPLQAAATLPPGADAYFDMNFGELMGSMVSVMPQGQPNPLQGMAERIKGTPPMTMSLDMAGATMNGVLMIPADFINAMVQVATSRTSVPMEGAGTPAPPVPPAGTPPM